MKRCFGVVAAVMFGIAAAEAADRYVSKDSPSPGTPWDSWTNAAHDIATAVGGASAGETVWVSNGTYTLTAEISVPSGITVKGFAGRDAGVVDGGGTYRCFTLNGSAVLDSLTISNGYTTGNGGGVFFAGGASCVTNCLVCENVAGGSGGGAFFDNAIGAVIKSSIVSNNTALSAGGVMCNYGGSIYDSTVSYNDSSYYGGLRVLGVNSVVSNCNISFNNVTLGYSGGISLEGNSLIQDSIISGNWNGSLSTLTAGGGLFVTAGLVTNCQICSNSTSYGGGILFDHGGLAVGCTIVSNSAASGGGGIFFVSGGFAVGCTVASNSTPGYGGGFWFSLGGSSEVCRIRGNRADNVGGGIYYNNGGEAKSCEIVGNKAGSNGGGVGAYVATGCRLLNCTLARNEALAAGGGGWFNEAGIQATNCIVYTNTAPANPDIYNTNGFGYSCSPTLSGGGNISQDPKFLDNGAGFGLNLVGGNFRLPRNSPCVNKGLIDISWMANAVDLDGHPRIMDGTVDMGAYESVPPPKGMMMLIN